MKIGIIGTGAGNMRMLGGDGVATIKDPIDAAPVVEGAKGKAWLCDELAGIRELGAKLEDHGGLQHWIVEAPWAHPAWHSYSVVLIHLRPMARKRTMIYLDGATHEIWVYAMNPDEDRGMLLANGIVRKHWLHPINFAAQFIEVTDDLAQQRVRNAVQSICDGMLSPDTDHGAAWRALFGDNMMKDRANRRPPRER